MGFVFKSINFDFLIFYVIIIKIFFYVQSSVESILGFKYTD